MTDQIELRKKVELILEKKSFKSDIQAKVAIVLDESGSMGTLFRNGTVSNTVDRALAIGYKFDDDGTIDVWSFSNHYQRRQPAGQDDHGNYLKHQMLGGSTVYHDVLQAVADDYFIDKKKESIFGIFKSKERVSIDGFPAFVAFITDGEPDSAEEAIRKVGNILRNNPRMFVQFIGIGNQNFSVLKAMAESNPNCAFSVIHPNDDDDAVLDKFLNEKARAVLGG